MKYIWFSLILFLTVLSVFSCDEENDEILENILIEWTLSGELMDTIQNIDFNNDSELEFTLNTNSLCPNTGVLIEVSVNDDIFFEDLVVEFPYSERISIVENNVIIRTELVNRKDVDVQCAWLGEVDCSLSFDQ